MSVNGVYGTNVGANISTDDIEIFYSYSPTRNSDDNSASFKQLSAELLKQATIDETRLKDPSRNGVKLDGCVAYIDNPEIDVDGLMKYIKGPDFPTGAIILGLLETFSVLLWQSKESLHSLWRVHSLQ